MCRSQMLFIGFLILLVCLVDAKWVAMTPEDAASTKCLRISGSRTEIKCAKFNARPDGGFKFEIFKCENLMTINVGENNAFIIYPNQLKGLTSPAVVSIFMNGAVHSDSIKDLTPSIKPIQLVDDHVEIGIGYVGDAIGCSVVLTQGYPVVEIADPTESASAGTGLTDSQTIGLVAGLGGAIGIGIIVGVLVYCHVKERNKKKALEKPKLLIDETTGIKPDTPVRKRPSKKKSQNASPRRRKSKKTKSRKAPSTEAPSTQVKTVAPKSAEEKKAAELRRRSRMSRLSSVLQSLKPDKHDDFSFIFSPDHRDSKKSRWSYFTTETSLYRGVEDLDKLKVNEEKFKRLGAPRINGYSTAVWIESLPNYLLNIHAISEFDWKQMSRITKSKGRRRILDVEADFLASYFDDAEATWEMLECKAEEIIKKEYWRFVDSPSKFVKWLISEETSQFHGICLFYKIYGEHVDAIKVEDRLLMRLPMQCLMMLLLRPDLSRNEKLKILYWFKRMTYDLVNMEGIGNYLLAYPMDLIVAMSAHHSFDKVDKEMLEGTGVSFDENTSEQEDDWVFDDVFEDLEAKIVKYKKVI